MSPGTVYLEEKERPSQDLSISSDVSVRAEVEDGPLIGNRKLWPSQPFDSDTSRSTLAVSDTSGTKSLTRASIPLGASSSSVLGVEISNSQSHHNGRTFIISTHASYLHRPFNHWKALRSWGV